MDEVVWLSFYRMGIAAAYAGCCCHMMSLRLFRAPQSVEVAILTGVDVLGVGLELSYRLVARGEVFAQHLIVVGDELDELDVVSRCHGVLNLAYGDAVSALNLLHDGHVLLSGSVGGVLLELLESAYVLVCGDDNLYDVATLCALIYFVSFCHNVFVVLNVV